MNALYPLRKPARRNRLPGRLAVKALLSAAILALTALLPLSALDAPAMDGPVNDLAGVMSPGERAAVADYLTSVNGQTSVQVAVLTVKSLEGDSLEDFSMRVADKWKLGQKGVDNGVLLLVAVNDRAVRIEVGYGLEGELTDAKSGLIIRNVMAPHFREGRYGQGIAEAVKNIVGIATGNAEIVSESVRNPPSRGGSGENGLAGIVFLIVFMLIMSAGAGRRGHGGFLLPFLLGSMLSGSRRNSHWGGGSGLGGGGFSGGGFSGGGGGFGGGGASGGW